MRACAGQQAEALADWGEGGALSLQRFCVQLDQRLLSLLAQTGAQHAELFPDSPRARLLKVGHRAWAGD